MKNTHFVLTSVCMLMFMSYIGFVSAQGGYDIGDQVEDFTLRNIDDQMVALSDYASEEGVIVIFTCNHCPFAVAYEDRINALHRKYAQDGYPVLAINPNDPEVQPQDGFEEMKMRAKEKGFEFAYLFDEGQKVYPQFGATRTPHVFLLDAERKVRYIGAIDDNYQDPSAVQAQYLEDAIAAIQEGNQPDPSITKAIGCTIKKK